MEKLEMIDISLDRINLIKNLWEKNRLYHEKISEYFGDAYKSICFEERMNKFNDLAEDELKISLCKVEDAPAGYCISTAINGVGEVVSVHVDESRRGNGIGRKLVDEHLKWMNEMNCRRIGVTVSQENLATINFYRKLGFFPDTMYMQQLFV